MINVSHETGTDYVHLCVCNLSIYILIDRYDTSEKTNHTVSDVNLPKSM